MKARTVIGCSLLSVMVGLAGTACGQSVHRSSLTRAQAELVQARGEIRPYAEALAADVRRSRISGSPVIMGSYLSCPPKGKNLVSYNYTITVRADQPTSITALQREVTGILRSRGWQLVGVDFAKVHLGMADTNHPLYNMSQHGMKGAANILPYGNDSAGALIFMHSPCIDAGSLALQVEEGHGV